MPWIFFPLFWGFRCYQYGELFNRFETDHAAKGCRNGIKLRISVCHPIKELEENMLMALKERVVHISLLSNQHLSFEIQTFRNSWFPGQESISQSTSSYIDCQKWEDNVEALLEKKKGFDICRALKGLPFCYWNVDALVITTKLGKLINVDKRTIQNDVLLEAPNLVCSRF